MVGWQLQGLTPRQPHWNSQRWMAYDKNTVGKGTLWMQINGEGWIPKPNAANMAYIRLIGLMAGSRLIQFTHNPSNWLIIQRQCICFHLTSTVLKRMKSWWAVWKPRAITFHHVWEILVIMESWLANKLSKRRIVLMGQLPPDVRIAESLTIFCKRLKTHLFRVHLDSP